MKFLATSKFHWTGARSSGMRGPGLSSEFEEFDTMFHTPCPFGAADSSATRIPPDPLRRIGGLEGRGVPELLREASGVLWGFFRGPGGALEGSIRVP